MAFVWDQGGGHYLEQNMMVTSTHFGRSMEFELTRSNHKPSKRGTVSMAFKIAPQGQPCGIYTHIVQFTIQQKKYNIRKSQQDFFTVRFFVYVLFVFNM